MVNIDREKYPELDALLWDIHDRKIKPEVAFNLYEKRWGFVDKKNLRPEETGLIKELTVIYGNGCFMPAN